MGALLDGRRLQSNGRLEELKLVLKEAETLAGGKACVYVTGSFGRGEASKHSDVDLFIVGLVAPTPSAEEDRVLSKLDEICLKADLIRAIRALRLPEFSGDGEYLTHYTVGELVKTLGTSDDDALNTFTARLLLLLESQSLIGADVYSEVINQVIKAYWRDFPDHQNDFRPSFLANDILRLWRTFCVNYEARTQVEPDIKRNKRRLKNYKLKHSRLLTCYSALLLMMAVWSERRTVTPIDARSIFDLTPTRRIEALASMNLPDATKSILANLLDCYEKFLERTDAPEATLLEQMAHAETRQTMFESAAAFGKLMFDAVEQVGDRSDFHRMLVV